MQGNQEQRDLARAFGGGRNGNAIADLLTKDTPEQLLFKERAEQRETKRGGINNELTAKELTKILKRADEQGEILQVRAERAPGLFTFSMAGDNTRYQIFVSPEAEEMLAERNLIAGRGQSAQVSAPTVMAAAAGAKPGITDRFSSMSDTQLWTIYEEELMQRVEKTATERFELDHPMLDVDGNFTQAERDEVETRTHLVIESDMKSLGVTVNYDGVLSDQETRDMDKAVKKAAKREKTPELIGEWEAIKQNLQDRAALSPTSSREELIARLRLMEKDEGGLAVTSSVLSSMDEQKFTASLTKAPVALDLSKIPFVGADSAAADNDKPYGAYRGVTYAASSEPRGKVREAMANLEILGFATGGNNNKVVVPKPEDMDGIPGPAFDSAVKKFQKENGLDVTGKLDERTMVALGKAAAEKQKERAAKTALSPDILQEAAREDGVATPVAAAAPAVNAPTPLLPPGVFDEAGLASAIGGFKNVQGGVQVAANDAPTGNVGTGRTPKTADAVLGV